MPKTSDHQGCPFCGGKPRIDLGSTHFNDAVITCTKCGTTGPIFDRSKAKDEAKAREANSLAAWAHWDTRVSAQAR